MHLRDEPFTFHLSRRLCPSAAGCSPPSMPSIVLCCFPVPGGSFLALLSCHLLLRRPFDLFLLIDCHCAAFSPPTVLDFCCVSGPFPLLFHCVFYNVISFVIFLIYEHGVYYHLVALDLTFSSPLLFGQFSIVCQLFIERQCLAAIGHC